MLALELLPRFEKARKQLNSFDIIKASSSVCCVSCACIINSQGAQYDTRKDLTGEESRMCPSHQEACYFCAVSPFSVEEFHIEVYSFRACNYTNT